MRVIILSVILSSISCVSFGFNYNFGAYGDDVSYFKFFTSKKLIGDYRHRYCQILNFPPFDSPEIVFIVDSPVEGYKTVVYRHFNQKQLWIDGSRLAFDREMYYGDDYVQAIILNELNTSVHEVTSDVAATTIENLIDACKKFFSNSSARTQRDDGFDTEAFYLTHFDSIHGYSTIKVSQFDIKKIKKIKGKMQVLINQDTAPIR